ncbi:MAG: flagellar basal body P-ring formation chaperone FlgA [Steroidobacteraceae bacterium]
MLRNAIAVGLAGGALIATSARAVQSRGEGIENPAAIRAAARDFVRAQLAHTAGISTLEVGTLDDRLRLARCARALHAELPPGMALQARSTVGVRCESPVHWMIYVPVTVERQISVLVLRHAVRRGALVSAADVGIEKRRVAGLGAAYLESPAELAGRALRRMLPAGTTLTLDMFAPDAVVHRGQEVTLLAGSAAIQVRALGRALEDAAAGARLKVQNLSSTKVVEGVAESSGVVRVPE